MGDSNIHIVQKLVNIDEYHGALTNAGSNLVVIFFYSSWSVPSLNIEQELAHLQHDYPEGTLPFVFNYLIMFIVEFSKVDVDTNGEVSEAYSVVRMPTILFIKHSKTIDRLSEPNMDDVMEYIEHYR